MTPEIAFSLYKVLTFTRAIKGLLEPNNSSPVTLERVNLLLDDVEKEVERYFDKEEENG